MRRIWDRMRSRRARTSSYPGAMPGAESTGNAILEVLDEAEIPWRSTRAHLAERYGVRQHPAYQWDVIEITTKRELAKGLLYPLSAQVWPKFSPRVPATEFSALAYFGDDARRNIELTAEQFAPRLGEVEIAPRYNTLHCQWNHGLSEISLTSWPPDMQSARMGNNPAHQRDKRLVTACHIEIQTGFRLAPTAEELQWLRTFVAVGDVQCDRRLDPAASADRAPFQSELEFVRTPAPELDGLLGHVGHSADRRALIFRHEQLYIVPAMRVIKFEVVHILPARGRGGSSLVVECATDYEELVSKRLTISSASGLRDLDELGRALAAAMQKPCEVSETYDD